MRMRRKKNQQLRLEQCQGLLQNEPEKLKDNPIFTKENAETRLELGCGKGRFTVETALAEPSVNFIAIEKYQSALVTAMERAVAADLKNVLFINALADNVQDYFAPGVISRIYINFCDPWPAQKHEKRRLTGRRFLNLYKNILKHGGEIHFKTDNLPLFEFSLLELEISGFTLSEVTRDLHKNGICGVMTDYESKFHDQGITIKRCIAALK